MAKSKIKEEEIFETLTDFTSKENWDKFFNSGSLMAEENNRSQTGVVFDAAKRDACLDLAIRRVAYSTLAGTLVGLLLFRSRTARWASVALGGGCGVGSAFTQCSYLYDGPRPVWAGPRPNWSGPRPIVKPSKPEVIPAPSVSSPEGQD